MKKIITFISCEKDLNETETKSSPIQSLSSADDTKLKTKFAKAIAIEISKNLELRKFLKEEALKKINRDYDVVYHVIKNVDVNSNANYRTNSTNSLHSLLLPYFSNEQELIDIENQFPLLTIFVPDLQEGSFSAENWNTISQIPLVAVRSYESNDVKCYGVDTEFVVFAEFMPDFPVIVIKDNERLVSNVSSVNFENLDTRELTSSAESIRLKYSSINYDPIQIFNPPAPTNTLSPRIDLVHQNAFNAYSNYTPGGWQRDFIYYGLTPTTTSGTLKQIYREYLTSFKLQGDATNAYIYMSSNQDPKFRPTVSTRNMNPWTDGNYDIEVKLSYGAKNSALGIILDTGFDASPSDLFEVTYVPHPSGLRNALGFKRAIITATKMMDLMNDPLRKVQFSIWDLNNFSNQWKIKFEEFDAVITTVSTQNSTITVSNNFNVNFAIEPATGILKKFGLRYGATNQQAFSNTFQQTSVDISDNLKEADINFYDNVVDLNSSNQLVPRKNYTGRVEFEIRPRLVY